MSFSSIKSIDVQPNNHFNNKVTLREMLFDFCLKWLVDNELKNYSFTFTLIPVNKQIVYVIAYVYAKLFKMLSPISIV
jgi:hypothetical protein